MDQASSLCATVGSCIPQHRQRQTQTGHAWTQYTAGLTRLDPGQAWRSLYSQPQAPPRAGRATSPSPRGGSVATPPSGCAPRPTRPQSSARSGQQRATQPFTALVAAAVSILATKGGRGSSLPSPAVMGSSLLSPRAPVSGYARPTWGTGQAHDRSGEGGAVNLPSRLVPLCLP